MFKTILENHPINSIRVKAIKENDGRALYTFWYKVIKSITELLPVYSDRFKGYFLATDDISYIVLKDEGILIKTNIGEEFWSELEPLQSIPFEVFNNSVFRIEKQLFLILNSLVKFMTVLNEPVTKDTLLRLPNYNCFRTEAEQLLYGKEVRHDINSSLSLVRSPIGKKEFFFFHKDFSVINKGKDFLRCYIEMIHYKYQKAYEIGRMVKFDTKVVF